LFGKTICTVLVDFLAANLKTMHVCVHITLWLLELAVDGVDALAFLEGKIV